MGKFFEDLRIQRDKLKALNPHVLINTILNRQEFKDFIVQMNTQNQLFDLNIDSTGVKLVSIGGEYSDLTLALSKTPKKSKSAINLKDTGEYYESFKVSFSSLANDYFTISSDPQKDDDNLEDRWGTNLEGLTDENLTRLAEKIKPELASLILSLV